MNFRPGGEYLPHDWVDEGKLLLFMKTEVAERPPRTGRRLTAEKKRKQQQSKEANRTKRRTTGAGVTAEGEEAVEESGTRRPAAEKKRKQQHQSKEADRRKQRTTGAGATAEGEEAVEESDDDDEEPKSELQLMYNTVRGYVSAIMKLYNHQISMRLHSSPSPHNVAIKAMKTSIARGQHQRRRAEFEDRGIATIKDGYAAKQIPDMTRAVWQNALGPRTSEQSFRTNLDFLLGHAMLLRQSNRLPLELPDLFAMDLPKEGQKGTCWCFAVVMDQGKHYPSLFLRFSAPADYFYFCRKNEPARKARVRCCFAPPRPPVVSRWLSSHLPFLAMAPLWRSLPMLSNQPRLVQCEASEKG
jgi:hypothetical protein